LSGPERETCRIAMWSVMTYIGRSPWHARETFPMHTFPAIPGDTTSYLREDLPTFCNTTRARLWAPGQCCHVRVIVDMGQANMYVRSGGTVRGGCVGGLGGIVEYVRGEDLLRSRHSISGEGEGKWWRVRCRAPRMCWRRMTPLYNLRIPFSHSRSCLRG